MFKKRIARWPAAVAMLSALLVMLSLYTAAQAEKLSALSESAAAAYERAFYETAELMSGIENNLDKLFVTGSSVRAQELLGEISRAATAAQNNLDVLPASLAAISESLKFVNQAGDYAAALDSRLSEGDSITDSDRETLRALRDTCTSLNALIDEVIVRLERGEHPLSAAAAGSPLPDLGSIDLSDASVDYPVLLYDGPFSDGRGEKALRALEGQREITADEAKQAARRFIGEDRISALWLTGEGSVPAPCYEMSAYVDEGLVSLAVTKQGGQILFMMIDAAPAEPLFDASQLVADASRFLRERGYGEMTASYWTEWDGFLTVNFVPVQDGVPLYPDLVKVELSMETGEVVGLEALNYLTNHVQRVLDRPKLSEVEARERLNPSLDAAGARLCLIPLEQTEKLAYEFSASLEDTHYLVYIDALTGEELVIYRLIEDENGQLAM